MCWSLEASGVVAAAGFAATGYAMYKGDAPAVYATIGYFSVMEALQAATYLSIDDCSSEGNQLATVLSYLHIAFQPFFINLLALHFVPDRVSRLVAPGVYVLCFIAAITMLVQLYPFEWAGSCEVGRPLCGAPLCAISGEWHIAWQVPANGIGNGLRDVMWLESGYPSYVIMGLIAPVIYGSWRFALFHFLLGPTLAHLLTDNINEWPAIWCLVSVGLLVVAVESPVRRALRVRSWMGWGRDPVEDEAGAS